MLKKRHIWEWRNDDDLHCLKTGLTSPIVTLSGVYVTRSAPWDLRRRGGYRGGSAETKDKKNKARQGKVSAAID